MRSLLWSCFRLLSFFVPTVHLTCFPHLNHASLWWLATFYSQQWTSNCKVSKHSLCVCSNVIFRVEFYQSILYTVHSICINWKGGCKVWAASVNCWACLSNHGFSRTPLPAFVSPDLMGVEEVGENCQAKCHLEVLSYLSSQKPFMVHNVMSFSVKYPL